MLACSHDGTRNHGQTIISADVVNTDVSFLFKCWMHVNVYFHSHYIFFERYKLLKTHVLHASIVIVSKLAH